MQIFNEVQKKIVKKIVTLNLLQCLRLKLSFFCPYNLWFNDIFLSQNNLHNIHTIFLFTSLLGKNDNYNCVERMSVKVAFYVELRRTGVFTFRSKFIFVFTNQLTFSPHILFLCFLQRRFIYLLPTNK